jgi:hypothetical protein
MARGRFPIVAAASPSVGAGRRACRRVCHRSSSTAFGHRARTTPRGRGTSRSGASAARRSPQPAPATAMPWHEVIAHPRLVPVVVDKRQPGQRQTITSSATPLRHAERRERAALSRRTANRSADGECSFSTFQKRGGSRSGGGGLPDLVLGAVRLALAGTPALPQTERCDPTRGQRSDDIGAGVSVASSRSRTRSCSVSRRRKRIGSPATYERQSSRPAE